MAEPLDRLPADPRTAAVLGLGLMGGSLARDLAARGVRVLGYDHDEAHLRAALDEGVVHTGLGPALAGLAAADLVALAVPVGAVPALLAAAAPQLARARLVLDLGSVQGGGVAAARALGLAERFVGAHPLVGDHRSGWAASRTGLFHQARVLLCPAADTATALELAEAFWAALGARTERLGAQEHDRQMAWVSHLPQAASTALANALAATGLRPDDAGPGGRAMLRLAASSPALWTAIALQNAQPLRPALAALEAELAQLRRALTAGDEEAVFRFFAAARQWAERSR